MKKLFVCFLFLVSISLKGQDTPVNYPYQSVFIGLDSYIGYNEIGDAFKWKYEGSTNS